ncbi:unnamed protein product [Darwinula stevensoni]|uniref:Uncharacterized protein n=1 Tax=Darwinula stevensoni TaxID=69355 RepID=A0A7R8X456_9CRUS|nr:unnamed protein product [Darwinula stevensoni]CAG0883093.1 unnamed protein product [Darwinula stevensoni]
MAFTTVNASVHRCFGDIVHVGYSLVLPSIAKPVKSNEDLIHWCQCMTSRSGSFETKPHTLKKYPANKLMLQISFFTWLFDVEKISKLQGKKFPRDVAHVCLQLKEHAVYWLKYNTYSLVNLSKFFCRFDV